MGVSFNVSRYPSMTEITDSKSYNSSKENGRSSNAEIFAKNGANCGEEKAEEEPADNTHNTPAPGVVQYVPAEYGRPDQAVEARKTSTVSAAKSVAIVKPEVLASGRLLTHMSPVVRATSFETEKKSDAQDRN